MQNIPRAAHEKNKQISSKIAEKKSKKMQFASNNTNKRTDNETEKGCKGVFFFFKMKIVAVTTTITGRNKRKTTTAESIV